tara:strand:- start:589 stop:699 length:111 start_codon:yes stop_codon:yes gene_type:complete
MKFGLSKEGIHVGAVAYGALLVEEIFGGDGRIRTAE